MMRDNHRILVIPMRSPMYRSNLNSWNRFSTYTIGAIFHVSDGQLNSTAWQ